MQTDAVVGVVAFIIVAGYAALAWFRHGRDPAYQDDASVLMPAPPPAMTAATATVVSGGATHVAFMAALLDLASRDEIAFVAEDRPDHVGIAFRGGETTDPRVLLNRRNPIGEAESWLLGMLKASKAMAGRGDGDKDGPPSPEMIAAGAQMMSTFLRLGASADSDDSFDARAAREHGMASLAQLPDAASLEAAYEARTGHAMTDRAREGMEHITAGMAITRAMSDPAAVAADPERYATMIEQARGEPVTPEEHLQIVEQVRDWATRAAAVPAPAAPDAISAAEARRLQAPFLFGTFIQTYAKRHGWIGGLSVVATLRWSMLAAIELAAGIGLAVLGSRTGSTTLQAAGGGVAAGGLATWIIGGRMPALSKEGAVMKAQLAAYRRTLAATFGQATTLDDVVASHQLPWLETPDQAIVWGMALGLRKDVEGVMARTARARGASGVAAGYSPPWYARLLPGDRLVTAATGGTGAQAAVTPAPSTAIDDPAAMFAGIEAIGSEDSEGRRR
jgi:hypothetical protein